MQRNPEIQRNLWLEFSTHRLLGMPLALGLIFFIVGNVNENAAENIAATSLAVYFCIVKLWGGHKAASAIIDEVNDHTWDSQKLSALSPWTLSWGKLFGSTIYTWYGGIITFFAFVLSGSRFLPADELLPSTVLLLMSGLIVQAAALLSSMTSVQSTVGTHQKLRTIFHLVFGLIIGEIFSPHFRAGGLFSMHSTQRQLPPLPDVVWYGQSYNLDLFMVVTGLVVLIWLISSIYWQMRAQMKMKAGPWLWAGFLTFWACFYAGFDYLGWLPDKIVEIFPTSNLVAFGVIYAGLYFIVFQEQWTGVSYRRSLDAWKSKNYKRFFELCPRWIVTFPLCVAAAFLVSLQVSTGPFAMLAPSLVCLAARDIALLHFFKLSPANRRPKQSTVFYMGVLYILIPFLLNVLLLKNVAALFVPIPGQYVTTIVSAMLQALVIALLVNKKWQRHWMRYE